MFVSVNMAMSIDGKIAPATRGPVKLGSDYDSRRMAEIRADHDAVINGSTTFRAYPFPLKVRGEDLIAERARRGLSVQPISAISASDLAIPLGTKWQNARDVQRWVFCGKDAPAKKARALETSGVRVFKSRKKRPSPEEILGAFAAAGASRVLVEGGGEFNASFFAAGLVDRIYVTLVPILVGGKDAPTICEGKGFAVFPRFKLAESRQVGEELYLVYEKSAKQ